MNPVFAFFARRHKLASLFTIMILLLGLNALRTLKRDQFPRIDLAQMDIRTTYPGASPEDVELNVTNKIEEALKQVSGIDRILSASFENKSEIEVYLDPDVKDLDRVKQDVRDAVAGITDFPPQVSESPEVDELSSDDIPILEIGISGELPYAELREIARELEEKIRDVEGVSTLLRFGYLAREVKVEVSPGALERYQIPLQEIVQAIAARNIRQSAGTLESFTNDKNVVTLAQFQEPGEVGNVIVRSTFDGPQIRIRDLAVVRDGFEERSLISRVNGVQAISFMIYRKESADILRTADRVKSMIREEAARAASAAAGAPGAQAASDAPGGATVLAAPNASRPPRSAAPKKNLPEAVLDFFSGKIEEESAVQYGPAQIHFTDDVAPYVRNRLQIVLANGVIGLALVLVLLTLFLNIRTAFWVALGIPVSVLGVCFLLPVFGRILDSLTLATLVLVIGIVVDEGIVISENISRHREMGKGPLQATVEGLQEVFFPVLTTVLTTILAFVPLFFMSGVMGQVAFAIAITVCLALSVSLSESVLALPAHLMAGMSARKKAARGLQRRAMRGWFDGLRSFYRKVCFHLLKVRYLTVLLFLGMLAGSVWWAATRMDFVLFPSKGAHRFFINLELPMGSSLEATSQKVKEVEAIVRALPDEELENFVTKVGMAGYPPFGQAGYYAMIAVRLTPYSARERSADEIVEELRSRTDRLEGYEDITYQIDAGGPPVGKPIDIKIVGTDDEGRRKLAGRVQAFLESLPGVKDVTRDDFPGKDQLEIDIDYSRLARFGLTSADVAQTAWVAYDGQQATTIRQGDEEVAYRVQLEPGFRAEERFLLNLPVPNRQGRLIRLKEVAAVRTIPGLNAYRHYEGKRATSVTSDIDTDVTTALEVGNAVSAQFNMEDWPGLELVVSGEAQETGESIVHLAVSFAIACVGIYFLLVLLFDSFGQPFLVLAAIPFGCIGVILALALHGEPLGFLAMVGLIGLSGVVVNDSLVLVSHLNELRKRHPQADLRRLIAEGTADRLRAILLTTLTTAAGVLPLAYGMGGYDLYMAPMALTLGWGLLFATLLTLMLVPSLYLIGHDVGRLFGRDRDSRKAATGDSRGASRQDSEGASGRASRGAPGTASGSESSREPAGTESNPEAAS
jgi:multidrug efflux pump subunit AcrB